MGALIVVAVVILLSGGFFVYHHVTSPKISQISLTASNFTNTVVHPNQMTSQELSQRKSVCKNLQNSDDQNACYGNLAIDANDLSICQFFGSRVCGYFNFMWHTSLCSDIQINKPIYGLSNDHGVFVDLSRKQECIKNIAISTNNADLCKNLFDMAENCQDAVAINLGDASKCSNEGNPTTYYGSCVMKIAVNKKDITICESRYDKAWCIVEFPRLLQTPKQDLQCYVPPIATDDGYRDENNVIKSSGYSYPNNYDNGANDYSKDLAPQPYFKHLLSIPFNSSNSILRVYMSNGNAGFVRLIKYSASDGSSKLIGDVSSQVGGNWGGIYVPMAISKDDSHVLFNAQMGSPGAGGGSTTLGYASLSLTFIKYDNCGYLNPEKIANQAYFYDNFSKVLFYAEAGNVPPSEKPGPNYNSSLRFRNIVTAETKTLLQESNTIYQIINIDEKSGIVNFKSCPWQEHRFECLNSDPTTQNRSLNLPLY